MAKTGTRKVSKKAKPVRHNPTEAEVRTQVKEYLQWQGWFVYYNLAGLGSYPGLSDLVAVKDGRVVHIELKRPTGKQSERQEKFQRDLEAAGGEYLVARGVADVEHLGKWRG